MSLLIKANRITVCAIIHQARKNAHYIMILFFAAYLVHKNPFNLDKPMSPLPFTMERGEPTTQKQKYKGT